MVVGLKLALEDNWFKTLHFLGQRQSWRAGADCKSVAFRLSRFESYLSHTFSPVAQWLAQESYTLKVVGSSPARTTNCDVAQLVE